MKVIKRFWDETGECFGEVKDSRSKRRLKQISEGILIEIRRNFEEDFEAHCIKSKISAAFLRPPETHRDP
jgi:hypothetical protein